MIDAKTIVEKLGIYSEDNEVGIITIPNLSVTYSYTIETENDGMLSNKLPSKKQTYVSVAKQLQKQLDQKEIVLSDTWAEDNIGA